MSTIKDVARRTGLSLSTISKYLNGGNVREENRLAIDAAIEELDYSVNVFARSLKANRSMTIGVLLPTISSPFFGRVVAAMEPVLRRSGYECFVCSYDFDREQELEKLEFRRATTSTASSTSPRTSRPVRSAPASAPSPSC